MPETAASVTRSVDFTPYRTVRNPRNSKKDRTIPTPVPISAILIPCFRIIQDIRALRAQRGADAYFLCPLADGVGDHPVDADRRKHQTEKAEGADQHRAKARRQ